jgi:hypothetical protein
MDCEQSLDLVDVLDAFADQPVTLTMEPRSSSSATLGARTTLALRQVIRDRDRIYGSVVTLRLRAMGIRAFYLI